GDRAVAEVSAALRLLGSRNDLDVIVLIRGGGSRTELATFDNETIARAIAASPLAVLTGLGHEVDRSVADEVAHSALKTPTACAAALTERVQAFRERCLSTWISIGHCARRSIGAADNEVGELARSIRHRVVGAVGRADDRLGQRVQRVRAGSDRVVDRAETQLRSAAAAVRRSPTLLDQEFRNLEAVAERVRLLDPVNTMARGWSVARTADGRAVTDAAALNIGDVITTTFAKGAARTRVEETQS
ncbi:MAG: hypothetical protein HY826_07690, partial [Actinobacteria bacterium]|nr:hypothetical protein [Actinomycetota bacterium]